MSVKQHPTKGDGYWQIRYQPEGRRDRYVTIAGTQDEALALEQELRRQARGAGRITAHPTLNQAYPDFMAHYAVNHMQATVLKVRRHLSTRILPFFGKYIFTSITPRQIDDYKKKRLNDGRKHSTINNELLALKSFCRWAKTRGYCGTVEIELFPRKLVKPAYPDVPSRIECLAIINSLRWPTCALVACLYFAGLRSAEARNLRAEHVWLDKRLIYVHAGKGNKNGVVPIPKTLHCILEKRLAERPTGLLWPGPNDPEICIVESTLRRNIARAARRAGVNKRIYPHLFRHAYGVHATEYGVGLRALQQAMRHSSSKTTEIYSHLHAEAIIHELDKFDGNRDD